MLELGTYSCDEHAAVGEAAAQAVDELVLVGSDVHATAEAALQSGMSHEHVHLFAANLNDREAMAAARYGAATLVRERLQPDDLALIKGSLGVGMDAIVRELLEQHNGVLREDFPLRTVVPARRSARLG
jgi:UDP-N-acetylmuramyl pentapeptide synthase